MDELAIEFEQGGGIGVAQFSRAADDQVEYGLRIARRSRHRLEHIDNCGLVFDPFAVVAVSMREFRGSFGTRTHRRVELCPQCRWLLEHKYGGRIEDVPVRRMAFSEKNRSGIGTFTPSDPKSQDIAELVGGC